MGHFQDTGQQTKQRVYRFVAYNGVFPDVRFDLKLKISVILCAFEFATERPTCVLLVITSAQSSEMRGESADQVVRNAYHKKTH